MTDAACCINVSQLDFLRSCCLGCFQVEFCRGSTLNIIHHAAVTFSASTLLGVGMQRSDGLEKSYNGQKAVVECALTKTLIDMDFSTVSDLFAQNETGVPAVLWNPSVFDISHPIIKSFAEYMLVDGAVGTSPRASGFSNFENQSFAPWIMVLEPVPDRADFRYLQYGSEIAEMFGRDLTGHCTSEIGGHIAEFFIALYSAVIVRKQTVLSVHVPPSGVFATVWRRLIFPLMDEFGQVRMIAAINVPDNELRAGLEALPDPALVTQKDGSIMYANASARQIFGEPSLPRSHISEYCDMNIELPADAERLAQTETSTISQTIGTRNQVLVHFELRTSATFFRGTPYFVVQMRPY